MRTRISEQTHRDDYIVQKSLIEAEAVNNIIRALGKKNGLITSKDGTKMYLVRLNQMTDHFLHRACGKYISCQNNP